ncbi:TIGR04086 family membrane protein [Cohnella pontilimi]|uniref:TIGR04086 family membrane protein n=1 Tax=Cohnella pontilimi TaxID=2564100 RepID=A0A4U0F9H8_9BACL|nr:TIGR04086 family membrane protein [Cohnella pontilimi]TJY41416.1 TIGR04086 family membrane protein [Cohnella pontilimi]
MSPISRMLRFRVSSPVLSGLIWSAIWLAAGALFLSLMLTGSALRESELLPWVFGIHGLASLAGGFVSARRSGRKGWYFGMLNGILYTALILLTSFLATDAAWTVRVPIMLAVAAAAGAVGGMLGVNTGTAGISGTGKRIPRR